MRNPVTTDEISTVAVIGAGSWGTALANLLAQKGVDVNLWVREEEVFNQIQEAHINKVFLPDVLLDERLKPVRTFQDALDGRELVLMVVPSHVFRQVLMDLKPHMQENMSIISATKGIENQSLMVMSQVTASILPEMYMKDFACIDGPSFAKEVSRKLPTAVTVACPDIQHAERLQRLFNTDFFRVYVSRDVIGVELGGALKNVIAIAAGAADGLKFGLNARAALITRGLAEITRLGVAMGANPHTFAGLAGMGDLVLTCTGDLSRNRTVGLEIGRGRSIDEITHGMTMVAEGIKTARSTYELAKKMGVDMPITTQVYQILYEGKNPKEAVKELMSRGLKAELEH
ncbi:Glycerol-3-phosphate dehydrogenase (NAD(P)+) [uncultured Desulfobacterium sp.]|uniref:Glycerol-3-phosphate dehydrogenase [NAD(P)+] n=1 Tax=uncultured Desulfobacterium sp. TaxID=201089 RepID=A0A445MVT3_9BACT|nr:Glycerol-3-phosphate dehydrogenase (NAD(P)+) [uncultured Desulfobacterium sp.]